MSDIVIGIHQPNFIPWLGYFNKIHLSSIFVLIDDVQFVKQSVCNRVRILNNMGEVIWLTVPVSLEKGSSSTFNETRITDPDWYKKARNVLKASYFKTPYFDRYFPEIEDLISRSYDSIATLNVTMIKYFCSVYNINTPLYRQSEIPVAFGKKNLLNLEITQHFHGNVYLSGQGAKKYNDHALFEKNNIEIRYQEFIPKPYEQPRGAEFVPSLSILDLLFCTGEAGEDFIK